MLDQLNSTPVEGNSPPGNLMQEVNDSRKADSQAAARSHPDLNSSADSQAQAKTVELSDPFKDKTGEAALQKPSENSIEKKTEQTVFRYDNANLMQSFVASMKSGLPLVVQVGESWCPHCQHMDTDVWPQIEGSAGKQGSLQGKAIFLHLDYDQSETLEGYAGQLAANLRNGVKGFPTYRMYSVASDGKISFTAEAVGEMSQANLEKFLKSGGVK